MAVYEFPASFGQQRMWLLAEMDPGEPTYNIAWALWLDGALEVSALQEAFDAALVRHEALRTTFRNESGVPVQVIEDEPAAQPLPVTSVEHLGAEARERAAADLIGELARVPFDLGAGPLARAALVRLSPESHVLAVVMHHIVADGWSFRILFDELAADYAATVRGGKPVTPEPPVQYADFAIWQLEHAEDGGYAPDTRFWRAELADAPPALPLPADRPYPAHQTFAARSIDTTIDAGLTGALRELAARNGTTLFAVLLAAYAVVLARLTGSDDLLIAVPMAARTRPETESVVGLFMNTVPIRVRLDRDATLSALVRAVHAATGRVLGHQDLPFARIVELVRPDRDPARLPLVQVMFAMEESWAVPDHGGLRWRPELLENGTAKFEIELTVTDAPQEQQLRVTYNSDVFDAATGQLVADGFLAILRCLRDDPDLPVADAQIMPPGALALVTRDWPDAGPVADPDATALGLLRPACAGDSVVATGSDGDLTGAGVRDLADAVTAALRAHGTGIGDRVAILLPRGARLLPAILGVWSAGASYVPMDPVYPDQRLATMLADSGAAAILIDSSAPGAPGLPAAAAPVPVVDLATLAGPGAGPPGASYPVPELPPSATAITIFTSGSTGRPKAVSVTQGGIAALLSAVGPVIALGPQDRFVAVSSFAFDIALVELLAPVLAGGRVVVADSGQVLDAARLRELLTESGATAMQATPSGWRMLVDAGGIPAGVKLRMTAGEPLPRDLADTMGAGTGVRVWNLYGPTETTIYSGGDAVGPSPAPIEIGSIIAGTQLYVLDAGLRPVPPGVLGEVYIGGAGVAAGYHGAPGLTAGRFVPDPFSGPGARLYRTGDVGRWRESGRIELAGRADRQIKIRGYRIESGEVEAVLRSHEDIAQAVVSVRGTGHDVRLVGYLVIRSGAELPPDGLREYLRKVLPDYMVPAAFVTLPALLLTGSGKIDHRALPEPDWGSTAGPAPVAPRTPEEARIAAIVAELLGLPAPVGVSDNFFALGGHSLTATRLMARIRAVYGVDLPIRALFSEPTVAGLAAALAAALAALVRQGRRGRLGGRCGPVPAGRRAAPCHGRSYLANGGSPVRFPVSFGQQRLWFLDQLTPGEPTWNMPYSIWLDGPLDVGALQRAMDSLAARQAVLRTSLIDLDGLPEQVVADSGTVLIERIELPAGPDEAARIRQAESIAADRAREPFDLARGPLMRAALVGVGPDRHLFILVMHHSISDGATVQIVLTELSAFYRAETSGAAASLPPLWLEFGDYAVWQRDRLRGEELERLLSYWRGHLRGAPELLSLPADRPRPARQSSRGAVAAITLDAETTGRLAAVAHGADATLFMLFLTGFAATLSRYAGQRDIVIETQVAGRTHAELDPIAGMFTNTVALRLSLGDDRTFAGLLSHVKDATLDALTYQELPFEKLVEDLAPERSLARSPISQVLFLYGSLFIPPLDVPGISSRGEALFTGTSKLDITMYADTGDDQSTTLTMEYSTDLFDPPWAERFLRCMGTLLTYAADAPGTAVADLPLLSGDEVAELVTGRNSHASRGQDIGDVRPRLAASASRVIAGDEAEPMSQVCDRAARLARTLADLGVGPETPVGLCTGRGVGMLTALLAVWWAGGPYVPLDPDFPAARLAAMARGAGLRIVVADAAHRDLAGSVAEGATVVGVDDPVTMTVAPLVPVPVPASALAYIIFTSGSTGPPKGVGVPHRAVANLLASFRPALRLGPEDRFVAVTTLSFDIALLELLLPLVSGSDLVIATTDETREPDRLRSLLERTGATAMQATPQTWRLLVSAGGVPARLLLRLCGGESLPPDLAGQLAAPRAALWNLYGPTETTVWSAAGVVTGAADAAQIGPPIDHTRMYVLDDRLRPVPAGVVGEVFLAGRGVARGYHDRPRLTARSFRPDPWSSEPGGRMYRTGDLGRWRDGAGLELVGRNDHQVKIRGFRIELGEIEAVLRAHRDVRQAVVVTAARAGEPALVAYIVPRRGSALAQPGADLLEGLRAHLRATLPDYMVPALVAALPALPLTPNAKVDRAALPAPHWGAASSTARHVQPRNPVEETLARIWSDLLATEAPVSVHDNLFAVGGHSLTATRLVARVADTYGVRLPVHQVFEGPTIAELAEAVSADPDFGNEARTSRHADLDALSDDDLDDLLRAALAQRNRRQASAGNNDSS